jgi:hypothetical protein
MSNKGQKHKHGINPASLLTQRACVRMTISIVSALRGGS